MHCMMTLYVHAPNLSRNLIIIKYGFFNFIIICIPGYTVYMKFIILASSDSLYKLVLKISFEIKRELEYKLQ